MSGRSLAGLRATPLSERREATSRIVVREVKRVMGMGPGEPLPTDGTLFELGMKSLELEMLKSELQAIFDCPIDAGELFSHPTVSRLTDHLMERVFGGGEEKAATGAVATAERALANEAIAALYRRAGGAG